MIYTTLKTYDYPLDNQEIDKNIYPVRDPGEDFPNVEVKAITYTGKGEPELKIKKTEYEARDPSLYVLVRINKEQLRLNNTVEILGTISKKSFDQFKIEKQYETNDCDNISGDEMCAIFKFILD